MENDQIKLSIVVAVYNLEKYLPRCLDALVSQTLKDIEIICVDDGSTDGSLEKLLELAEKDNRISVYRQAHLGLSSARNVGIEQAVGRYLYFMDSDDIIKPCALEKMVASTEKYNLDVLCFDAEHFYDRACTEKELQFQPVYQRKHEYPTCTDGEALFSEFCKNSEYYVPVWMMLCRREMILQNQLRFFSGIIHEDNVFSYQIMIRAKRAGYLNEVLYRRRIRPNSIRTSNDWLTSSFCYSVGGNLIWKDYLNHRDNMSDDAKNWSVVRMDVMFQHSLDEYRQAVASGEVKGSLEAGSPYIKLISQRILTEERYKKEIQKKDRLLKNKDQILKNKDQILKNNDRILKNKEIELEKVSSELQEILDSRLYKILVQIRTVYRLFRKTNRSQNEK